MKRLTAVALALSFIGYLVACGGAAGAASPKDAVSSLLEATKNGDLDKMKTLMSKADLAGDEGEGPTAEDREEMKKAYENMSWEIGEETIDGDSATVKVTMKQGEMEFDVVYNCVKEDGSWKVNPAPDVQLPTS